jgi:hypothetical protein
MSRGLIPLASLGKSSGSSDNGIARQWSEYSGHSEKSVDNVACWFQS